MFVSKKFLWLIATTAFLALLAGCTNGGSSSPNTTPSTDTTPPQVLSVSPADAAVGVARTSTVVISFNEDMQSSTINAQSFTLSASNAISGTVTYNNSARQATFTPTAALAGATVFTAAATGMTDLAGNALPTKTWSFTTQSSGAPVISVNQNLQLASFGDTLVIDASGTTDDVDAIGALTFTWTVPPATTITGLGKSIPTGITAPITPGPFNIGLTVTDTNGNQSTATVKYLVLKNALHAAFVSATSGDDTFAGTRLQPVKTLAKALTIAQATAPVSDIYIEQGSYAVSSTTSVPDGVSLYGEFNNQFTTRTVPNDKSLISTHITGSAGASPVLQVISSTLATTIDGLHVVAPDLSTPASIALLVDGTGSNLSITNNYLQGQNGANGAYGSNGAAGFAGTPGANGAPGAPDNSASAPGGAGGINGICGVSGGKGGDGVYEANGGTGVPGSGGASGGPGGAVNNPGLAGAQGTPGSIGGNGSNGAGGTGGTGAIVSGRWTTTNGSDGLSAGQPGQGGGGGGAGGGQNGLSLHGTGNGGGGGGSGGCGGSLGTGGSGGGASIAIFLNNSSPSIQNNYIKTGAGGAGGAGGQGGAVGAGGAIGLGNTYYTGAEIGIGGNGGRGGDGGKGGEGGGGGGGVSIGIYSSASTPVQTGNTFSLGLGGAGGASIGNSGASGLAQNVY